MSKMNEIERQLFLACEQGNKAAVSSILNDPRKKDTINLQWQNDERKNGPAALGIAACKGFASIIELLLNHPNIDPNYCSNDGFFPLFITCQEGQIDILKLFVATSCCKCQPGNHCELHCPFYRMSERPT